MEAGRPDTITREKLEVLQEQGIGRISINPQTLEEEVLRAIGRRHTPGDIREAYALAREVGFDCINMDLIAGLPRDSFAGFHRGKPCPRPASGAAGNSANPASPDCGKTCSPSWRKSPDEPNPCLLYTSLPEGLHLLHDLHV